ncbi:hypothetical protein CALVIDRAFT_601206 [Calocera viscosa TUFC12733]|uniref:Uncharacterized protein n=1 Tax=Calocera viscosa (strain TUFC12733) TaxID=1330018 RepID=A0A167IKN7_CALVF|nr:hypothetical protein CALVIDRAFT_601206 [Calocera viscosa TUFC12733]
MSSSPATSRLPKPTPPSRAPGTPLGLPIAPSRPSGTPIGIPIAPSRPAGTPLAPSGASAVALPTSGPSEGVQLRQPPPPPAPPVPRPSLPQGAIRIPSDTIPISIAISVGSAIPRREVDVPRLRVGASGAQGQGQVERAPVPQAAEAAAARKGKRPAPWDELPAKKKARKAAVGAGTATGSGSGPEGEATTASAAAPADATAAAAPTATPATVDAAATTTTVTLATTATAQATSTAPTVEGAGGAQSTARRRSARVAARVLEGEEDGEEEEAQVDEETETAEDEDAPEEEEEAEGAAAATRGKKRSKATQSRKRKRDAPPPASAEQEDDPEGRMVPSRRGRRTRSPSLPMLTPGEPLDASATLMLDILRDPGVGRVSNRFVEAYRAKKRLNAERKRERELKMAEIVRRKRELSEAVERGLETTAREVAAALSEEAAPPGAETEREQPATGLAAVQAALLASAPAEPDGPFRETHTAPQIRLGAGGEWEVDEEHLLIDRAADPALQHEEYEEVEERESDRFVTSFTWSRKRADAGRGRWTREEVELLCRGVGMFGYDFEMISRMFVGRSRGVVKNKWKRMEREQPERAQAAWESREAIDLSYFSKHVGTNLLLPAAPIARPPPPDPDYPAHGLSVQRPPVPDGPAPRTVNGELEEEVFDMDVGEEEATFEEVEVELGQEVDLREELEELPSMQEAMMLS